MSDLSRQEQIELILDHFENPRHYGELPEADVSLEGGNPGCGDIVTVYLKFDQGRVSELTFTGQGCTISQAATSMLTEELLGKTMEEIEGLDYQLISEMIGDEMVQTRPKCATLGLDTVKKAVIAFQHAQKKKDIDAG
jgi:nitrogen fixation NifU-like protein